jgi:hypothetical protein
MNKLDKRKLTATKATGIPPNTWFGETIAKRLNFNKNKCNLFLEAFETLFW